MLVQYAFLTLYSFLDVYGNRLEWIIGNTGRPRFSLPKKNEEKSPGYFLKIKSTCPMTFHELLPSSVFSELHEVELNRTQLFYCSCTKRFGLMGPLGFWVLFIFHALTSPFDVEYTFNIATRACYTKKALGPIRGDPLLRWFPWWDAGRYTGSVKAGLCLGGPVVPSVSGSANEIGNRSW